MIGTITLNGQITFLKRVLDLIEVLFLGWTAQPATQSCTYRNHFQDDCSQTQRCNISRAQSLFLDCFLVKTIRVLLPRLPTEGKFSATYHDSLIRAFAASSTLKVKTNRSATPIGGVPGFRKAFKQISK